MKLTDKQKKSQEVLQQIFLKAWEDASFKNELMANPVEAIEKATGERIHLANEKTLLVQDQTDESIIYINIPAEPRMEDMELSAEQLEAIAGGMNLWSIPIVTLPIEPA